MTYTIHAKIASREYHVYKNINWENVKAGEKKTIEIETNKDYIKIVPHYCVVKATVGNPAKLATVGHIPMEFSKHVYFFLKEEVGKVEGLFSLQYIDLRWFQLES